MRLQTLILLAIFLHQTITEEQGQQRKACYSHGFVAQPSRRINTTSRLNILRDKMSNQIILENAPIDGYIVLSTDEHQSVDVDEFERRREFISGFSGSYGDAIITQTKAALWTDGRYILQADEQLNCDWLLMKEGYKNYPTRAQWLKKQFPEGARIGVYSRIISEHLFQKLSSQLNPNGIQLIPLNIELIDLIWPKELRGTKRNKDAFIWENDFSGKNYSQKLAEVRSDLKKNKVEAMIVTALDEIAWLLNLRGRDIPYTPFVRSYVILDFNDVFLYVNQSQFTQNRIFRYLQSDKTYLKPETVQIKDYNAIWGDLLINQQRYNKILIPSHCVYSEGASHAIYQTIPEENRLSKPSPIIYLKARKNPTEIEGMRRAHIQDAAALCDCFSYIEKKFESGQKLTELDLVEDLNRCRFEQTLSMGNSFRTIVGFGSNGAQPNYEPTKNTNSIISRNSTLVVDSGGQYKFGTTDVTRTLHFGQPTEEQREAYTRVLIGSIQLASLTFPEDLKMAFVDVLTRAPLWEAGQDFKYESGHGIGAFLSVQESPISLKYDSPSSLQETFKPGYFLTSQPGYYQEGDFGIRLENVLQVIEKKWLNDHQNTFLGFDTITFVPYEPKLIKMSLLSKQHKKWLDHYNAQIRHKIGTELKLQNKMHAFYWMMNKTDYIPYSDGSNRVFNNCTMFLVLLVFLVL